MKKGSALRAVLVVGAACLAGLVGCGGAGPEKGAQPTVSAGTPMPDSAFQLEWVKWEVPAVLTAGQQVSATVTVRNTGTTTWPDPEAARADPPGAYAVRLSHRWWNENKEAIVKDYDERIDLTTPIKSKEEVTISFPVTAPLEPGAYQLQCDLVQEFVAWFESKGAKVLLVPVRVQLP